MVRHPFSTTLLALTLAGRSQKGREGHQIHQKRIDTLDFSLEQSLEELGHIGLSRIRSRSLHLGKVLGESSKTESAAVVVVVILRLLGLGFCLDIFLPRSLLGFSQRVFVMEDKCAFANIPIIMILGRV